jgi:methylated-DNA-[protein]-cysteine S-methyltransferase
MSTELFYSVFRTNAGWMGILSSPKGLMRVILPQATEPEIFRLLMDSPEHPTQAKPCFLATSERLIAYFSGGRTEFDDKLDFSGTTPFQRAVWQAARLIPYGQTASYQWIAEKIGKPKAARAVGQALGKNRFPIIVPCHRVIASDGRLGGFSGGIEMKKYLLFIETGNKIQIERAKR